MLGNVASTCAAEVASALERGPPRMERRRPMVGACPPPRNGIPPSSHCTRCAVRVCRLPSECPACGLTLILSTHLARSYHHLFPLRNWVEVSWARAQQKRSLQCFGCLAAFPPADDKGMGLGDGPKRPKRAEGASESSRYECETCQNHFCIDCDVFCHEVVHNCPGCQSSAHLPGVEANGTGT